MNKVEEAAVAYRALNPLQRSDGRKALAKVVPLYQWGLGEKIDTIKEGISKAELENLKEQTELDYAALAKALAVTKATLHAKKGAERFDAYISERILLLADIYSYGYSVFGSRSRFNAWMKTASPVLGGETPLGFAETVHGMAEVKNLIGRIDYGVFS